MGFGNLRIFAFDCYPGFLGLVPNLFDAVEFGAVREQEVQGQALFVEQINKGRRQMR